MLEKANNIEDFLLSFHPDYSDYDEKTIIQKFISDGFYRKSNITLILEQGQVILSMNPFPWEWISDVTNRLVYDKAKNEWVEDPDLYKAWVEEILTLLEQEARKQGKL